MVSQQPLEMILIRQFSRHLASPVWLLDSSGELVFYNEPAEQVLGLEFAEIGAIASVDLTEMFEVTETNGEPLPEGELPIIKALREQVPSNRTVRFRAMDGVWRTVEVLAMPIIAQHEQCLGVMATFWEVEA